MPTDRVAPRQPNIIPVTYLRSDSEHRATLAWVAGDDYEPLAQSCASFLHPNELSYFRSLRFERRRRSYLLGRCAAKQALMAHCHLASPTEVEIASGIFQHPVVRPGLIEPTGISISHSERIACALAYHEVHPAAIDVEDTAGDRDAVMRTQILPRELERAATAWEGEPHHAAMIWTAKEALSKILRCGMTCPYELLAVSDLHAGRPVPGGQFESFGQYRFQSWVMGETVLSIVFPRNSTMTIDMAPMIHAVSRLHATTPA
jgi:4'-phosphopantetheinyl transferase